MLVKLKEEDFDLYIDFIYSLAIDITKSGYPTYTDGIKTKENFIMKSKSVFQDKNTEILLFIFEGKVEGWIHYYFLPEDHYISTSSFNINRGMKEALREFYSFVKKSFPGNTLWLGFSDSNKEAIEFLREEKFICMDQNNHYVLNFDDYTIRSESNSIKKITRDSYDDFRQLHSLIDHDMYWNSERLLEKIDNWNIYVYYQDGKPVGAIYFINLTLMLEIFGLDYAKKRFDFEIYKKLLVKCLNEGKKTNVKHLTYFAEECEDSVLKELGFRLISKYSCYSMDV